MAHLVPVAALEESLSLPVAAAAMSFSLQCNPSTSLVFVMSHEVI